MRLSFGLSPWVQALRACTMKRSQPDSATTSTKRSMSSYRSSSSTPIRCFTVTGMVVTARIAATASATRSGSRMSTTPKAPVCTRALGQPTFRSTSS